jgi:hypothetical protein
LVDGAVHGDVFKVTSVAFSHGGVAMPLAAVGWLE